MTLSTPPPSTQSIHEKPLLTIAIPTYNRSLYLRELLESLRLNLDGETRVELIVSDNASQDDTPSVVAKFQREGLRIHSIRNEVNIGADRNFLQCFNVARGKYFWLIGDDDVVAPGAIPSLLDRCQSAEYDMLYLSQFEIKGPLGTLDRKEIRNAITIYDARAFAVRIHVFFTFISANIVNRDTAIAANHPSFDKLLGTNLGQLAWTFAALDSFRRGLFVHDTLLGARNNIAGGYQLFDVFGPKLKAIVEDRIRSHGVRKAILNGTLRKFFPGFALKYKLAKIPFNEDTSLPARLTPTFRGNIQYWLFLYPVLVLPFVPAAAWYLPYRTVDRCISRLARWVDTVRSDRSAIKTP